MRPIIGISSFDEHNPRSTYTSLNVNYSYSVSVAGGIPFILPGPCGLRDADNGADGNGAFGDMADEYVGRLDGLLLSGGSDVAPYRYGESPTRSVSKFDSGRDGWELALLSRAVERGIPVLGICRGCQLVNVALGGTLYQDIAAQLPLASGHSFDVPMNERAHYVDAVEGSRLRGILGTARILTNSFHHQSVKDVAPGLVVSALADDGVIEGIESADAGRYLVCVQFHPEALTRRYPEFVPLFASLVEAASRGS